MQIKVKKKAKKKESIMGRKEGRKIEKKNEKKTREMGRKKDRKNKKMHFNNFTKLGAIGKKK